MNRTSIEPIIDSTAVTSGIQHQMLRNIPCRFDVGHIAQWTLAAREKLSHAPSPSRKLELA